MDEKDALPILSRCSGSGVKLRDNRGRGRCGRVLLCPH